MIKTLRFYLIICSSLLLLTTIFALPAPCAVRTGLRPYFTDRAQYNYAKFLFDDRDYIASAREFARVIEDFPGSEYISKVHFMMASSYLNAGRFFEARRQFGQFVLNFPHDPLVKEAKRLVRVASRLKDAVPVPQERRVRQASAPMRAVQVFYFGAKTVEEMDKELSGIKRGGIDTIIVRVFQNPGDTVFPMVKRARGALPVSGVYFASTHAPVIEDILSVIVARAHRNGLKIFAWMTTRYADYGVEDREDMACKAFDPASGRIKRCKGLDIFNDAVVRRLEGLYSELASYDIDGILFQDDLVLRHTEGFGDYASALYMEETGRPLDPLSFYFKRRAGSSLDYTARFWEWAAWKNRRLLYVTQRLKKVVLKKRPNAKFALNLMYEAVTNPGYGLAWLSQDIEESKKVGFDYYSVMAYHRQMADELGLDPPETRELVEELVKKAVTMVGDPQKVLIKLQTKDWNSHERIPDPEVVDMLRTVQGAGNVSLAIVPYMADFPFAELSSGKLSAGAALREPPLSLKQRSAL